VLGVQTRAWLYLIEGELDRAERLLDEGVEWDGGAIRELPSSVMVRTCRGALRLMRGRHAEARLDLEVVFAWARAHPSQVSTQAGLAAALLAVTEQRSGAPAAVVWPMFAWAERAAQLATPQPEVRRALPYLRALLCNQPMPAAPRLGERDAAGTYPYIEEVGVAVVAAALAAGADLTASCPNRRVPVRVAKSARWFETADSQRIDLWRRPMMQRLLAALARAMAEQPDESLVIDALLAAVWPDDRSSKGSLRNRLRVAISSLRSLGLYDALLFVDGGYRLDPQAVELVDP
jgi:hypothetical protein